MTLTKLLELILRIDKTPTLIVRRKHQYTFQGLVPVLMLHRNTRLPR